MTELIHKWMNSDIKEIKMNYVFTVFSLHLPQQARQGHPY
jgi:hypothetical protein